MAKSCWHFTCWKTKNNIKQHTYCEREKLLWIAIHIAHKDTHIHAQIQMVRKVHVRRKWRVGDLRQAPMGSVKGLISLRIASEWKRAQKNADKLHVA